MLSTLVQWQNLEKYCLELFLQKLNCSESDVRWAIKNGDPHDQLKIAYHLILDNKRMKMLGKWTQQKFWWFGDIWRKIIHKPTGKLRFCMSLFRMAVFWGTIWWTWNSCFRKNIKLVPCQFVIKRKIKLQPCDGGAFWEVTITIR